MVMKTVPAVEARVHFGEIIKKSFKKGDRFIVEKSGIPMVVILNANEYARYARMIEEREERFKILDRIKSAIPGTSSREVEKDINETIEAVRKKRA